METVFSRIPPRDEKTGRVNVVIDSVRGNRNKFKFDEELGCFKLSRILPAGHSFPYDFGSIPGTRAEDGDALDVLLLIDAPTFPGCLVTSRLIGVVSARQTENRRTIRNDRLVAVPETFVNKAAYRTLEDFGSDRVREIEHFFVSYNAAQGRTFKPLGAQGPRQAEKLLDAAIARFAQESQ